MKKRLVILISGSGTNMEKIIREIQAGKIDAEPVFVLSDKPDAKGLERAKNLGVAIKIADRKQLGTKEAFENKVIEFVDQANPDFIVLAGFMRILSPSFVNRYLGKIINIHPSLLPAFPGAHGIKDAFDAKVKETGVTTHFVVSEVDAGPIILQKKITILPTDTLESLEKKIHEAEYEIYPRTLRELISGEKKFPAQK